MIQKAVAYVLLQHFKGVPVDDLLARAVPAPRSLINFSMDHVLIDGYEISTWSIRSIYKVPHHYWQHLNDLYHAGGFPDLEQDEDWPALKTHAKEFCETQPHMGIIRDREHAAFYIEKWKMRFL